MNRSLRFQISLNLMAVVASFTVVLAEYSYDPSSAVIALGLTIILLITEIISFSRSGQKLPRPIR